MKLLFLHFQRCGGTYLCNSFFHDIMSVGYSASRLKEVHRVQVDQG